MTSNLIQSPLSDEQKGQICGVLSVGCDRETAANLVDCTTANIHRAMQQDPGFAAHVRRTEAGSELSHMRTLHEAAKEAKNWRAAVWLLEMHSPERFKPRSAGDVTIRQLDEFIQTISSIICDEVESEVDQMRVARRMNEALRELDERVRSAAFENWGPNQSEASRPIADAEEEMADGLGPADEDSSAMD